MAITIDFNIFGQAKKIQKHNVQNLLRVLLEPLIKLQF